MSVGFTAGTDGGSGLGAGVLQRAEAPLTGATCATCGSFDAVTRRDESGHAVR